MNDRLSGTPFFEVVTVGEGGEIVLPPEVCRPYDLRPGTPVLLAEGPERLAFVYSGLTATDVLQEFLHLVILALEKESLPDSTDPKGGKSDEA